MKILSTLIVAAMLSGCVVTPAYYEADVAYEPDVVLNGYAVGYYDPAYGYWTGYGWDIDFYAYGHRGYGHYYRGAPRTVVRGYVSGPHYHGRVTYRTRVN